MKSIEVTDEMYDFLINLSNELNSQNNRGTASPYFYQIQTQDEILVPEGCGTEFYIDDDGNRYETDDELNDLISEVLEIPIEEVLGMDKGKKGNLILENLDELDLRIVNLDYKDKYENAFLTEKACKEHINTNSYHYNEPVDYLSYSFRNPELEKVLEFLKELSDEIK